MTASDIALRIYLAGWLAWFMYQLLAPFLSAEKDQGEPALIGCLGVIFIGWAWPLVLLLWITTQVRQGMLLARATWRARK